MIGLPPELNHRCMASPALAIMMLWPHGTVRNVPPPYLFNNSLADEQLSGEEDGEDEDDDDDADADDLQLLELCSGSRSCSSFPSSVAFFLFFFPMWALQKEAKLVGNGGSYEYQNASEILFFVLCTMSTLIDPPLSVRPHQEVFVRFHTLSFQSLLNSTTGLNWSCL